MVVKKTVPKTIEFRLVDFQVYNKQPMTKSTDDYDSDENTSQSSNSSSSQPSFKQDNNQFIIQTFGIDKYGRTYSMFIEDFQPYFFVKVNDNWTSRHASMFLDHIRQECGKYYSKSIVDCKLIKRHELYGFNAGKLFKFLHIKFTNTYAMNKVKNLFYETVEIQGERIYRLKQDGYYYKEMDIFMTIYESNIPPLLRFFHIENISPSGWVSIDRKNLKNTPSKITTCHYEKIVSYKHINALNDVEVIVPYKICSFDIEASSSHGDFPVPVKSYKKLATDIIEYWEKNIYTSTKEMTKDDYSIMLCDLILISFGYNAYIKNTNIPIYAINTVYPKKSPNNRDELVSMIDNLLKYPLMKIEETKNTNEKSITFMLEKVEEDIEELQRKDAEKDGVDGDEDGDDNDIELRQNADAVEAFNYGKKQKKVSTKINKTSTIIDVLNDRKMPRDEKLTLVTRGLNYTLPQLQGDKVTFIGSTFMRYGEKEPYLNHCIALDTCSNVEGSVIEQYKTEKQVLLAWTKLIQRENPDIIIGYNIFGFDYTFMFHRAKENGLSCLKEFLKLSRNRDEISATIDNKTENIRDIDRYKLEETSITIASGTHNLSFIKMNGRIQIDLYNYFRREYNLSSYKLDYVSGYFIGDGVKSLDVNEDNGYSTIKSKNLTGLKNGMFIHIEEVGNSTDYYDNGAKFPVFDVNETESSFKVKGILRPDTSKKLRWCMAKDDVSPQDIFRLTNEGANERAIIAKYCIQDCNLVHNLLNKIDIITGLVEMAKICSVPIDFLIMRGQGIKLFSFIAKQCRSVSTLIPVLEKKNDGGYEGAIVLEPKCGLYLDEPVACVDYSSLYPSSMISENLSHDSKVWTKEYDLEGNLIVETGEKDAEGNYLYDNLEGYKYVDVTYDTYKFYIFCKEKDCDYHCLEKKEILQHLKEEHNKIVTTSPACVKTHVGHKLCRFAQFPNGELAIMPRILKELLAARKSTRTQAKYKTITTSIGSYTGLVIDKNDTTITLKEKDGKITCIEHQSILKMEDTYDDFMKNVLDKRQLAIKVTANSLYGQCGARTSSFYEKDVAASTTATGRKLLTYGKRIIEEVYGDRICETSYGTVHSHAEYVYGDTDSVFMSFKLTRPNSKEKIVGDEALKITIELAQEAGALATKFLKSPHDLEYEKTFMPFCLLSKKRYVGMLYETDPNVCYRKSMGLILKRRDNANIVKDIYGSVINILMNEKDVSKAVSFTKSALDDIVNERVPIEKLIITKSLNGFYKNPNAIAHKVLADRMAVRAGTKVFSAGDRVPFVYIQTPPVKKNVKVLQGDKIEHPEYILSNKNVKIDYSFYITNQIMKPLMQLYSLILESIYDCEKDKKKLRAFTRYITGIHRECKDDITILKRKEKQYREKKVKELIFDDALIHCDLQKNNMRNITSFFSK